MNRSGLPFPRREIPGGQQQIRDLLVREASGAGGRRISTLQMVLPAAALAAAVAASTVLTGFWESDRPVAPAGSGATQSTTILDCSVGKDQSIAPARAKDLLYLAAAPTGWRLESGTLNQERYCSDGIRPVVSFVKRSTTGPTGTVSGAITVSRLMEDPKTLQDREDARMGGPGSTVQRAEVTNVTVRSGAGWLTRGTNTLVWQEPNGGYWSMVGSGVTADQLVSIAADLTLGKASASWPKAADHGFERLAVPSVPEPKEESRVRFWSVSYRLGTASGPVNPDDYLGLLVGTSLNPWQAAVGEFPMPVRLVTVNGRAGVFVADRTDAEGTYSPGRLLTDDGQGAQVSITGNPPSGLIGFANQLKRVEADDPRIRSLGHP
jgi:hypothetical protein